MTDTVSIPDKRYFKIGEVCELTGLKPHVLRYWESEFKIINPLKTKSNQRLYRKKDVEAVFKVKDLLYRQKFTIAGAKKKLKAQRLQGEPEKPKPTQLSLGFSSADQKQILQAIVQELKQLRKALDE